MYTLPQCQCVMRLLLISYINTLTLVTYNVNCHNRIKLLVKIADVREDGVWS